MKYIVYQTINTINNKIYIGIHKTKDPEIFDGYIGCGVLINSPSSYMNPYTPFQYAVKKYGTGAFKRSILKVFDTAEEAFKLESEIVTSDFIKRKDVYNSALGGGGGNQVLVPVNQFDLNGNLIKEWNSITEASEFLGVWHNAIYRAMKYKGSCKKFLWSSEKVIDIKEFNTNTGTVCYKYSSETGKCVEIYNSLSEAAILNNTLLSTMERAVKGGYRIGDFYYSTKLLEEYNGKPKVSLKNKILYVYNLNGDFIIELKNSTEICNFFNIKTTQPITTSIRLERPYKEWQFSFTKEDSLPKVISKKNIKKRVGRYSLGGDLLEEFDSIEQARKVWGSGVVRCVQGKQQQCKGYLFKQIS